MKIKPCRWRWRQLWEEVAQSIPTLSTNRGISIYIVHLGQYAFFTAVLHLVEVYASIAARSLFKGSPLVRQKEIGGIWLVDNEQKLWVEL